MKRLLFGVLLCGFGLGCEEITVATPGPAPSAKPKKVDKAEATAKASKLPELDLEHADFA